MSTINLRKIFLFDILESFDWIKIKTNSSWYSNFFLNFSFTVSKKKAITGAPENLKREALTKSNLNFKLPMLCI